MGRYEIPWVFLWCHSPPALVVAQPHGQSPSLTGAAGPGDVPSLGIPHLLGATAWGALINPDKSQGHKALLRPVLLQTIPPFPSAAAAGLEQPGFGSGERELSFGLLAVAGLAQS